MPKHNVYITQTREPEKYSFTLKTYDGGAGELKKRDYKLDTKYYPSRSNRIGDPMALLCSAVKSTE
mgnify:CR=1 FL=1